MRIVPPTARMLTLLVGATSAAWAQHGEHGKQQRATAQQLGEVDFPVSCNAAAQKEFNRAMALLHSFWIEPAKQSFVKVLEYDPECGMAY